MKKQTSIAIVNDISGMGRCSVTVALPILSAMKISCGIVPTAILSNQTEYSEYTLFDFTNYMEDYIQTWKNLNFTFDGIYTGFLGSKDQIKMILDMIKDFNFTHIIVDPVMGDHGNTYDSYTEDMCIAMKQLVDIATVITPNVTELCILTQNQYGPKLTIDNIESMCKILANHTDKKIIVTGIETNHSIGTAYYEKGYFSVYYQEKILPLRPGTGDVFASIIAGCVLNNIPLLKGVKIASDYVKNCLETSSNYDISINAGVCFEEHLFKLTKLIR